MESTIGITPPSEPSSEAVQKPKKSKKKSSGPRPVATPTPPARLYEKLGNNMVDKLVQDLQAPHDTPTLLDRLKTLGVINVQSSLVDVPKAAVAKVSAPSIKPNVFETIHFDRTQPATTSSSQSGTTLASTDSPTSRQSKSNGHSNVFTLGDFAAVEALSTLADEYGRVSHMGILDGSYSFFVTRALDAALYFKVKNKKCLVGGDPLCPEELYPELLEQFAQYRKKHGWGLIFVGASDTFISYAQQQKWTTIQFGSERVLNPVTNPVLHEQTAKRIVSQNNQLLNPNKGGITLGVYSPSIVKDMELQRKLVAVYDAWRDARNNTQDPQAFITVYDPFAIPGLMTYIYTMDRTGTPNGFAALRRIGANNGFHVDPCVASPSAPRGISDLLIFSSMALLNTAGCTYLSFGYEPLTESGEINGMPTWMQRLTRKTHNSVFKGLKVSGKKGYHDKWCPDEEQSTGLHLVFPSGTPKLRDILAVLHFANISVKGLALAKLKNMASSQKKEEVEKENNKVENTAKDSVEKETVSEEKPAMDKPAKQVTPKKKNKKTASAGDQMSDGQGTPVEGSTKNETVRTLRDQPKAVNNDNLPTPHNEENTDKDTPKDHPSVPPIEAQDNTS